MGFVRDRILIKSDKRWIRINNIRRIVTEDPEKYKLEASQAAPDRGPEYSIQ